MRNFVPIEIRKYQKSSIVSKDLGAYYHCVIYRADIGNHFGGLQLG